MQAGVKDLEADIGTLLEIPRLPFVSKEEEHASQGKIDLASVDGRNGGRLAPFAA
ncbi:MAG: hypothetical protein ACREBC_18785 [Pyrinomonadaceae bacterium]